MVFDLKKTKTQKAFKRKQKAFKANTEGLHETDKTKCLISNLFLYFSEKREGKVG